MLRLFEGSYRSRLLNECKVTLNPLAPSTVAIDYRKLCALHCDHLAGRSPPMWADDDSDSDSDASGARPERRGLFGWASGWGLFGGGGRQSRTLGSDDLGAYGASRANSEPVERRGPPEPPEPPVPRGAGRSGSLFRGGAPAPAPAAAPVVLAAPIARQIDLTNQGGWGPAPPEPGRQVV